MSEQPIHILSTRVAHVAEEMVTKNSFSELKRHLQQASQLQPGQSFERSAVFVKDGKKMGTVKALISAFRLKMHVKFANTPILKSLFKLSQKEATELKKGLKETAQAAARKKYGIHENVKPVDIDNLTGLDEEVRSTLSTTSRNPHVAYYDPQKVLSKDHYQVYQSITETLRREFSEEEATAYFKALAERNPEGLHPELRPLYEAHDKLMTIGGNKADAIGKNIQWYLDNLDKLLEEQKWLVKLNSNMNEASKAKKIANITEEVKAAKPRLQEYIQDVATEKAQLGQWRQGKMDLWPEQYGDLFAQYLDALWSSTNYQLVQDEAVPLLREALEAAKPHVSAG